MGQAMGERGGGGGGGSTFSLILGTDVSTIILCSFVPVSMTMTLTQSHMSAEGKTYNVVQLQFLFSCVL